MQRSEELQQEIEQLKCEVAQMKNRAALGDLLGSTTHEFNNILMTVINYAKLGLRHKDEPTRDKALDRILAAGERAAKITRSVLGMAKNRSADFAPTALEDLVEETMILLGREMKQYRIDVEIQKPDSLPAVRAIGNQIQQVLLNLFTNARQAMDMGGKIIVRLGVDQANSGVWLSIRDYGKGIDAQTLPKIFDPYFSTKSGPDASGKGGTGLGLSSCKEVLEQHQGRIRVDSTPGKGTMFTLLLPMAVPSAKSVPLPSSASIESTIRSKAV